MQGRFELAADLLRFVQPLGEPEASIPVATAPPPHPLGSQLPEQVLTPNPSLLFPVAMPACLPASAGPACPSCQLEPFTTDWRWLPWLPDPATHICCVTVLESLLVKQLMS